MKIKFKNVMYYTHWPKEFDDIIISVAKRYKRGKFIHWKEAEQDGVLKGLPEQLTLREISVRFSHLKNYYKYKRTKKRSTQKWLQQIGKKAYKERIQKLIKKRAILISTIPVKEKQKHGWRFKTIWSSKQKEILIRLVKKHRKRKRIDWKSLVQENEVRKLPYKNRLRLMKYYALCIRRPLGKKEKRRLALIYKNTHYARYLENINRYGRMKRKVARDFLLSKLTLRT